MSAGIVSDQVLVGLGASMLANGCYGAVRERLLQDLIYCMDPGYAQLGFPMERYGAMREDSSTVHLNVRLSAMIRWSYQALCMHRWCCPLPMVVWKLLSDPGNSHERWHRPKKAE